MIWNGVPRIPLGARVGMMVAGGICLQVNAGRVPSNSGHHHRRPGSFCALGIQRLDSTRCKLYDTCFQGGDWLSLFYRGVA